MEKQNMDSQDIVEFKDFIFLSKQSILVKQSALDPEYKDDTTNNFAVIELGTLKVKASLHLDKHSILYNLVDIQGRLTPGEMRTLLTMIENVNNAFLYPQEEDKPAVLKLSNANNLKKGRYE